MFSGWVGDQTGNWDGLKAALNNILRSAWRGYLNFGCDIGGYRTDNSKLGRTKEVFTRWFQLGALLPLMENGGNGEHRPWVFGNDTSDIYRVFANIHTNLAPFFLNAGTKSYLKNISVLKPLANNIFINQPSTYDYLINGQIYVSPITDNTTTTKLSFPGTKTEKWIYWFNNTIKFYGGDKISTFDAPYSEFPVFVQSGNIIPLEVSNHYTNLGTKDSKDYITLMIMEPEEGIHTQKIHQFQSIGYIVEYKYKPNELQLEVTISANPKNRFILLICNVYAKNSKTLIANNSNNQFETLPNHKNETVFWSTKESGTMFRFNDLYSQLFIRVAETAKDGIYLKIQNFKVV